MKYLWVAYKKGLLPLREGLSAKEFQEEAEAFLLSNYDYGWLIGEYGLIFGKNAGPMILLGDVIWFPWASNRNILEGIVQLINTLRYEAKVTFFSSMDDKRFYEHVAKHGILRRVGRIHDVGKQPLAFWESKSCQ